MGNEDVHVWPIDAVEDISWFEHLNKTNPRFSYSPVDSDHCEYSVNVAVRGCSPMKQHMECPRCRRVVEACCEGVVLTQPVLFCGWPLGP